jgi:hypothetical protein
MTDKAAPAHDPIDPEEDAKTASEKVQEDVVIEDSDGALDDDEELDPPTVARGGVRSGQPPDPRT